MEGVRKCWWYNSCVSCAREVGWCTLISGVHQTTYMPSWGPCKDPYEYYSKVGIYNDQASYRWSTTVFRHAKPTRKLFGLIHYPADRGHNLQCSTYMSWQTIDTSMYSRQKKSIVVWLCAWSSQFGTVNNLELVIYPYDCRQGLLCTGYSRPTCWHRIDYIRYRMSWNLSIRIDKPRKCQMFVQIDRVCSV